VETAVDEVAEPQRLAAFPLEKEITPCLWGSSISAPHVLMSLTV
jgi:hypothetical protein